MTTLTSEKYNSTENDQENNENNKYWLLRYEELEEQMKQMMEMTLGLIDKEVQIKEKEMQKKIKLLEERNKEMQLKFKNLEKQNNKLKRQFKGQENVLINEIKQLKKQNNKLDYEKRKLDLFKHRISVTYIGKITLLYISFKRKLSYLKINK
jgi:hypothetical protein